MRLFFLPLLLLLGITASPQSRLTLRLDSVFHSYPADSPGFVLSIEKKGEVLYRNAVGRTRMYVAARVTPDQPLDSLTNFRMASVTKQFTAMGIFLLEKEGRLSFDDPIGRWLPELPTRVGQQVMIRHLLTHTSGILDYEPLAYEHDSIFPSPILRQVLDSNVLHLLSTHDSLYFMPGSKFQYSNSGFCLLALIIERVSHQPFASFLKERVFLPLHMDHSIVYEEGQSIDHRAMGFARDSAGRIFPSDQSLTSATKGDGGVYTSVSDYSKWIKALQDNRLILLGSTLRRLRKPIGKVQKDYYAGGWFMTGDSPLILFHSGSTCGFSNFVIQLPGDEWSIFYFSNIADNSKPFRDIVRILQQEGVGDFSPVFRLHDMTN
ncbi:MAG TPA: serine hydrolase domain-containing protein [Puia sp.]|nr:serine hydrolase domain-containing protein [Puia sp.]